MQNSNIISDYISKVCEQVRWKKAHPIIKNDLVSHIEDQSEELIKSGFSEQEAMEKSIIDIGDPILIGSEYDNCYKSRTPWSPIILVSIIMLIGLFARIYIYQNMESYYITDIAKQIIFFMLTIVCLAIGYFIDYSSIIKHINKISILYLCILIITSLFFSHSIYRPYASIIVLIFPIIFACIIQKFTYFWPLYLFHTIITFLSLYISFNGIITYIISLIFFAYFIIKGHFKTKKFISLPILLIIPTLFLKYFLQSNRIKIIINPYLDPRCDGYLPVQIREVIKNSNIFGLGNFPADYKIEKFIPSLIENHMLVYYINKFGLISLIIIGIIFILLFAFIIKLIKNTTSIMGKRLSTSILFILLAQTVIYFINNTLGISTSYSVLPLFSNGNLYMLVDAFLIGILLSVFRTNDINSTNNLLPTVSKNEYKHKLTIHNFLQIFVRIYNWIK